MSYLIPQNVNPHLITPINPLFKTQPNKTYPLVLNLTPADSVFILITTHIKNKAETSSPSVGESAGLESESQIHTCHTQVYPFS